MKNEIMSSIAFLKEKGMESPEVGIVLGTGLGKLVEEMDVKAEVAYEEIPNFPIATVEFHKGRLFYGLLEGKKTIVMQGRFHLYEGYTLQEITFPIRVMQELGVHTLLISNAAGAVNLDFKKGDLMVIEDHINLQGGSPLAFKGAGELGELFVDMSEPYDLTCIKELENAAKNAQIPLKKGVYASVVGPHLETRAEYKMLKIIGADAVGMSSVPEVIVGKSLGLKTVGMSILTDECDPNNLQAINIPEIMAIISEAEPKMILLFKELMKKL